jgi:hypothetical protein
MTPAGVVFLGGSLELSASEFLAHFLGTSNTSMVYSLPSSTNG